MAPATFATALPQSSRSEVLEWTFPKPFGQYVLSGRSRAGWHTSFLIPQLDLALDVGYVVNKMRPNQVFITHGHTDHSGCVPVFISRTRCPDIYCPAELQQAMDTFAMYSRVMNEGGNVGPCKPAGTADSNTDAATEDDDDDDDDGRGPPGPKWLNTHTSHGMKPGDVVPLRRIKADIIATAFACDHSVPCLGYVFSQVTRKLRREYAGRPGAELKALRQAGVEITERATTDIFAFCGDTTVTPLAAEPEWLRAGIPVVIVECSFLYAEHIAQARKTKHVYWGDLEPIIRKWPKTTFVLMHFSMRYSDKEIRDFFYNMDDAPANMVVWSDGCRDDD
ncbi:hypothetical protein TD95_001927 [Thielaviopsis punctulata]|uniref:Metallo-beta-lactamase domain-containing protein n=1 Tax=Thielaviopsis punctulata TaxID=72032 RepID=A0A0F4ZGU8_9PEZI|nr:hypothetical protein TD95_001927 [Thielaviopsis punctulata]